MPGVFSPGCYLTGLENPVDQNCLMTVAAIICSFSLILVLLATLLHKSSLEEVIDEKIKMLTQFIEGQRLGWIVNQSYVRSMEFGSKLTWVFMHTLENDLNVESDIFQAVKDNLAAGTH